MMSKTEVKKRPLSRDEKARFEGQRKSYEEEKEYFDFIFQNLSYQLSHIDDRFRWELWEKKRQLKLQLKDVTGKIEENKFAIENIDRYIKEGMPIDEVKTK